MVKRAFFDSLIRTFFIAVFFVFADDTYGQTLYLVSDQGIHRADLSNPDSVVPELVYANSNVRSLAIAGDACGYYVVWQEHDNNGTNVHLFRTEADLSFQTPVPLLTNGALRGADTEYIYFRGQDGFYRSSIIDGSGYSPAPFQLNAPNLSAIGSVAFADGFVYWTTTHLGSCDGEGDNSPGCGVVTEGVYRRPTSGGAIETLASGPAGDIICGHNYFMVAAASGSVAYYRRCQIACCIPSPIGAACGCGTDLTDIYDCNGPTGFVLNGAVVLPVDLSHPIDIHSSITACHIRGLLAAVDPEHDHLYWMHPTYYPNLMRVTGNGASTEIDVPFTIRDIDIASSPVDSSVPFDLSIAYVEVSQGVSQQPQPFVVGKPLFVRAYLHYAGMPKLTSRGWDAVVHVLDSQGQPIRQPIGSENGPAGTHNFPLSVLPDATEIENDTLNFLVDLTPEQWTQVANLQVEVNPCTGPWDNYAPELESDRSNNLSPLRPIEPVCRKPATIRYYSTTVERPTHATPNPALIGNGVGDRLYQSIYPIPFYGDSLAVYDRGSPMTISAGLQEFCEIRSGCFSPFLSQGKKNLCKAQCTLALANREAPILDLLTLRAPRDRRAYWFAPEALPGMSGLSACGLNFLAAEAQSGAARLILAHELGHTACVAPADDSAPAPNFARVAYDVYAPSQEHISSRPYPLMGYSRRPDLNHWAIVNEHNSLLLHWDTLACTTAITRPEAQPEAQPPVAVLRCLAFIHRLHRPQTFCHFFS